MGINRISSFFPQEQPAALTVPQPFSAVPTSLLPNAANASELYRWALAAAVEDSQRKFLAIMRSLKN